MGMKVAYIINGFPNVSETFILDEITSVMKQGVHCHIYSLQRPAPQRVHAEAKRLLDSGAVSYYRMPGPFGKCLALLDSLADDPARTYRRLAHLRENHAFDARARSALSLAGQIEKYGPDVMHAHFATGAGEYARAVHHWTGAPFTVTTHHADIFLAPPDDYAELAGAAEAVVCISEFNRRYLESRFGLPPDKLRVIHCGINLGSFPNGDAPGRTDRRALRILCVARLSPVKGHRYLLEAVKDLRAGGLDCELVLVGDGPSRQVLEEYAAGMELTSMVRFLGFQLREEVLSLLAECDLFVLPSLSEGIPVSLMEAMACRRPVIATAVRGVPELVIDKVTGLLVPPEDPGAIAQAVRCVVDHPEEVDVMREHGREKIVEEFDRERCTQQLISLWKEVLG